MRDTTTHTTAVNALDFNPSQPNLLASAGNQSEVTYACAHVICLFLFFHGSSVCVIGLYLGPLSSSLIL